MNIDINQLFNLPAIIAVPFVLNALGWMLKQWPLFPDKYIPVGLTAFGPFVYWMWMRCSWTPRDFVIGLLCGPLAVGFHQVYKQWGNKDENAQ